MENQAPQRIIYGVLLAALYGIAILYIITQSHTLVSISYVFLLPAAIGAIPMLLSTREQVASYKKLVFIPWVSVLLFGFLAYAFKLDGIICLVIIIGPFLLVGTLAAFVFRLISLRYKGPKTPFYSTLLLPLVFLVVEQNMVPEDEVNTVVTSLEIEAPQPVVWNHLKSVRNIKPEEIQSHFIHLIHVPKPLSGHLDDEGTQATRYISWDKGIKFQFDIQEWVEGTGFTYLVKLDEHSIPPNTLDEHVMIGGQFFDVVSGSYRITPLAPGRSRLTLTSTYRVSTTFNTYSALWTDFLLDDLHQMILEVIKGRAEKRHLQLIP